MEMANMEDLTELQQVMRWSQHDIVVAADRADLTSSTILHNNSAVVEIFPPHYAPIK